MSVLSTASLQSIARVEVGRMPYGVTTSPDGSRILVASQSGGSISVLDSKQFKLIGTQRVGRFPEGLAVEPSGTKAYAANWFSGDVSVINVQTGAELKRIKTGGGTRSLALIGDPAVAPAAAKP
jgi:YVTN family beta-propeller protein